MTSLFGRLSAWDQVPVLLDAYADLRQSRCASIGAQELEDIALVQLPPGPARDARNAALRHTLDSEALHAGRDGDGDDDADADESRLRTVWEHMSHLFGYDALDAADDWWYSWGVVREASKARIGVDTVSIPIVSEVRVATP
jgi:salicylate hydroxylase